MKARPVMLLSAAAGCLEGYLVIEWLDTRVTDGADGRGGSRLTKSGELDSPSSAQAMGRGGNAREKQKSFAALLKEVPAIHERNRPCKEVERMDAASLKAAALEAYPLRGSLSTKEAETASAVFSAAVRELWRRDGEKALEWAAAEVPAGMRADVLSELLTEAAVDSPDLVKVWADRFRGEYGDRWAEQSHLAAVTGAARRGAEELLRVRALLSTKLLPGNADSYPEDFDFHLLVTGTEPVPYLEEPVTHWAARDKEGSWNGVKHVVESMPGRGTNLVGHLFRGVMAMEGEEKAAGWLVEKIGEIHPQLRRRALQHLYLAPLGMEATVALVRALPDPADKMNVVSSQF
ncbi:MAG: hypothetical protein EOP85_01415, partial [Verrucomicrobiaceae bacterium]